ncbi:ubiquitin-related domain-containing protein, partial [Dimargaris cristalligena]
LTCLLISGKRHTFRFPAGATIRQTKQQIYQEWPKEWESDKPDSPGFLRLLYLGKVLEDPRGLADYQLLPARKPTIVHLTIKMVEDPDVPGKQPPSLLL